MDIFCYRRAYQQSAQSKEEFLKQLEKITQGVKATEDRIIKKMNQEKDKRHTSNETYMELVEKQRAYFKTVREFQEVNTFTFVVNKLTNNKYL